MRDYVLVMLVAFTLAEPSAAQAPALEGCKAKCTAERDRCFKKSITREYPYGNDTVWYYCNVTLDKCEKECKKRSDGGFSTGTRALPAGFRAR